MLISLILGIHICKEIRILLYFTQKSFTAISDSVICNCNLWLIHMLTVCYLCVFHCIFGHPSYTAGDKTQGKPIPVGHQQLWIPVLQHPAKPGQGWDQSWSSTCQGVAALFWSTPVPCYCLIAPESISFLQAPAAWDIFPLNFMSCLKRLLRINEEDRLGKQM